jgi:hypothetical protein
MLLVPQGLWVVGLVAQNSKKKVVICNKILGAYGILIYDCFIYVGTSITRLSI